MQYSQFINPYENLYPIENPALLYGRQEILRRIFRRLFRTIPPRSLQLVGLARFGKSSVLNVLKCLNDGNYSDYFMKEFDLERETLDKTLIVHVNCAGLSMDESSQFWNLMDQQLTLAQSPSADRFKTQRFGNITFEEFARKLFAIEKSMFIFLFDGFERVLQHKHIDISHNLRFLLEKGRGNVAYISATPQTLYDYYAERDDAKSIAPLFSYFDPEPIYLGQLETEGAESFIKEPARRNGVAFSDDDIDFILYRGGQHPDLTRMLCKYLFDNYQLPPEQRGGYQQLYNQLKNYFEPFYNIITKEELTPIQLDALVRLAMDTNVRNVPDKTQDELIKLGLLIRDPGDNQIRIFSEVLKDFLDEEKSTGTSIKKGPQQVVVQLENEGELSPASPELKVWEKQRAVQVGDQLEHLTPNEWKLFTYLWKHANQTCTRDDLTQALSSNDVDFTGAALDITISRLRQKIETEPEKPRFIVTVRGRGYRFEEHNTVTSRKIATRND